MSFCCISEPALNQLIQLFGHWETMGVLYFVHGLVGQLLANFFQHLDAMSSCWFVLVRHFGGSLLCLHKG